MIYQNNLSGFTGETKTAHPKLAPRLVSDTTGLEGLLSGDLIHVFLGLLELDPKPMVFGGASEGKYWFLVRSVGATEIVSVGAVPSQLIYENGCPIINLEAPGVIFKTHPKGTIPYQEKSLLLKRYGL